MLQMQFQKSLRACMSANPSSQCNASVLIIGHGDTKTGDISFNGTIQVDGRVEGDIRCKRLVVTAQAIIEGAIATRTAHIEGAVNGPIDATSVFLGPTAVVKGNLTYEALNIATGASVSGFCRDRGRVHAKPFDSDSAEGFPPLPFSLVKAACRKSSAGILPLAALRLAHCRKGTSMKAVWQSYQQIAHATRL